ncbi:MFS family permease [Pseudorhizobium tarimense]|uniref:MFS family permease n=1 Tax=Pseudorhizobium tarimense TaxID=1079109 RepID=A0ABV2HBJ1_9HYPH|nr:MFS transporter [Pseudorhizobium tarimense]MCJ8520917.1 MFS transporter [Pseudorhizobium tarimense]
MLTTQFGLFAAGNGLSLIGTWMQKIACAWLIWNWTQSSLLLGVLAAGDLMPVIVVGPFAGVAADRWNRMHQNIVAQMMSTALALVVALLLWIDQLNIVTLIACVTLQGTLMAAVQPARLAMVQQMVAREDMTVAVAINSINVNMARMVGPAIAGVMITQLDIIWVFVANAVVTSAFVVLLLRLKLKPREEEPSRGKFLALMLEGFVYVGQRPQIRMLLVVLFLGGVCLRSLLELVPAIAAQTFQDATIGLAVLTGTAGFGAMISGLTVRNGETAPLLREVLVWWGTGAMAGAVLTNAPHVVLALPAAAFVGAAITRGLVGTQTFIQLSTPDALRGRVLSVHGLIARASPAVGALGIGYFADRIGLPAAVSVASVLLLVVVLGLWLRERTGG